MILKFNFSHEVLMATCFQQGLFQIVSPREGRQLLTSAFQISQRY